MLSWLASYAQRTPTLHRFLSVPLTSLSLPSLHLYSSVVAAKAGDSVLDAMRLMSDEGVSSVAIVDDETGGVLSAVSVTDVCGACNVLLVANSEAGLGRLFAGTRYGTVASILSLTTNVVTTCLTGYKPGLVSFV